VELDQRDVGDVLVDSDAPPHFALAGIDALGHAQLVGELVAFDDRLEQLLVAVLAGLDGGVLAEEVV
jgi:hypothetical protein